MDENLAQLLTNLPVFVKLSARERVALERAAIGKNYDEGEIIAFQGDIWQFAFVLVSGEIAAQKMSFEGRSLGAWRLTPPQIFWSPSMFDEEPLPATLEARLLFGTTPVMVCKILSRFGDQGMIKVSRTEFEFVDYHKLEQLAVR